jgi:hypothetical protein
VYVEVGDSIFKTSFDGGKLSLLFYKPYLSCIRKMYIVFVDEEIPGRSYEVRVAFNCMYRCTV